MSAGIAGEAAARGGSMAVAGTRRTRSEPARPAVIGLAAAFGGLSESIGCPAPRRY